DTSGATVVPALLQLGYRVRHNQGKIVVDEYPVVHRVGAEAIAVCDEEPIAGYRDAGGAAQDVVARRGNLGREAGLTDDEARGLAGFKTSGMGREATQRREQQDSGGAPPLGSAGPPGPAR